MPIVSLKMLASDGNGEVSNILDAASWLLQTSIDGITPNDENRTNAEALGVDVINMSFGFVAGYGSSTANTVCGVFAALRADGVAAAAAAGGFGLIACLWTWLWCSHPYEWAIPFPTCALVPYLASMLQPEHKSFKDPMSTMQDGRPRKPRDAFLCAAAVGAPPVVPQATSGRRSTACTPPRVRVSLQSQP